MTTESYCSALLRQILAVARRGFRKSIATTRRHSVMCTPWLCRVTLALVALGLVAWFMSSYLAKASTEEEHAPSQTTHAAAIEEPSSIDELHSSDVWRDETDWTLQLRRMFFKGCNDLFVESARAKGYERLQWLSTLAEVDPVMNRDSKSALNALYDVYNDVDNGLSSSHAELFCIDHEPYLRQPVSSFVDPVAVRARINRSPANATYFDWRRQSHDDIKRGAIGGYAAARTALGDLFSKAGNHAKAVAWWRLAAADMQPDALLALGYAYTSGTESVPQNFSEAARLYELAAARVHHRAFDALGVAYLEGRGVRKSLKTAVLNFRRGAALDSPYALYNLAVLTGRGEGVPQNTAKARELMEAAADEGCAPAKDFIRRSNYRRS